MLVEEFALVTSFLKLTLGATAFTGGFLSYKHFQRRADKLTSTFLGKPKELKYLRGDDGLKISKNFTLDEKYDFEGVCMIAPTGAGKTTSLFLNNLLDNRIRGSYVVTDPKGELYELTSGYQKNVCGRKVYKIDFTDTSRSELYNLLENCKDAEEVVYLASNLLMNGSLSVELITGKKTGGVEWIQMAEPLLSSVLLYVRDLEKPYNTIEFALQLILNLNTIQLKNLITNSNNLDAITQYNIFLSVGGADKTEGSIKITLATNMRLFTMKDVNKIGADSTMDINKFREEESILYLIYPERKSNYLAPFISPLFSQLIDKLLDSFKEDVSLPVHMLFDEFANIGIIQNMQSHVATCRYRKLSFAVCLQSISQLKQIYGEDNSRTILNNLKTKIVLPGISDVYTLKYISQICGNKQIKIATTTVSEGKTSTSYSSSKKLMFEEGELRTLAKKKVLIISSNFMPVVDDITFYYESSLSNNVTEKVKYPLCRTPMYNIEKQITRTKAKLSREFMEGLEEGRNSKTSKAIEDIFMNND